MLASRVLPGAALVRASVLRASAFSRVDLPTFERPASAICASPSAGIPSRAAAASRGARDELGAQDFQTGLGFRLDAEPQDMRAGREPDRRGFAPDQSEARVSA